MAELLSHLSWFLVPVTLTLAILWLMLRATLPKGRLPPYPVKPWPVFGHLFMLARNPREKLVEWRQSTGDIFSLKFGSQLHILVHDYELIREIWTKNADCIVNAVTSFGSELAHNFDKGVATGRDENWHKQRTVSSSILRMLGMGKNIMADKIEEEVLCLLKQLKDWNGQAKDVKLSINNSVSNIICSVMVGKRFDLDDPVFHRIVYQRGQIVKYMSNSSMMNGFRYLYYLPGDLFKVKCYVKNMIDLKETFVRDYVKKHLQKNDVPENVDNFIIAYIQAMKKEQLDGNKTYLDESNLVTNITHMLIAGTDTITNTILWGLLFMLRYPEVQEKIYLEILSHVGTERLPNMADKPKLTYLNATILEINRKGNITLSGMPREVNQSFQAAGFDIPKGTILWPIIESVCNDTKIWGDPENFRPERFIDENGTLIKRNELISFGMGRRVCLGEGMARMELYLFFAALFQKFRFKPESDSTELSLLKQIVGLSISPLPYKIRFIPRE